MAFRFIKRFRDFHDARIFLVNIGLVISVFIVAIFAGIYFRSNDLIIEAVRKQAVSDFDLIVRVRSWNALMEGVYVIKDGNVASNPYLRQAGIEPDIQCGGGRTLTLRNPSLMTKEISEQTRSSANVFIHMTSLKPINPANAPDVFERRALERFQRGEKEVWQVDRASEMPLFRYMAPLYVDSYCMKCHGKDGYSIGDIRGGISINIPFGSADELMRTNRLILAVVCIITIGLLLGIVYFMGWRMLRKLERARRRLTEMATTDDLTQLLNRRAVMERLKDEFLRSKRSDEPFGVIMIDIDHFKRINDAYGHPFGDLVLKAVADRIKEGLREYDIVGRIGGEEFFVLCADTSPEALIRLAERLCEIIKASPIGDKENQLVLTVSAGVTSLTYDDQSQEALFRRADDALYKAKHEGRDRVVSL